jgi:single-strand DNA-binding protein
MNKTVLIGRITKDVELKYTPGQGTAVTTITLAIDRKVAKGKDKETDFISVVIWGKQAESTAQYMHKGSLIGVVGRIQTRSYESKDKEGARVYVTEVIAEEVDFLSWDDKDNTTKGEKPYSAKKTSFEDMTPIDDGDIPF